MTDTVVLVDDEGTPYSTAPKATVHSSTTPLHLAFSCYVFNPHGQFLMTRRALSKATWPGVWTNSACGHLGPHETALDAVHRWVPHELGIESLDEVEVVLPDFRYRAVDSSGIVEYEICPVFIARISADIAPDPTEVDSYRWVNATDLIRAVDSTPFAFSPWMVEQLGHQPLRERLLAGF
ncbi:MULTISPECIES: isopentenyl-diphosphate Delta-isomerase [unclassified Corynebacterium]|uniref:isopentenyl-diphosphate Delta-isomerase n=1 Tax=unclassified Corynebacterium TaxID=2624378 RepID=UPI002167F348|nr:MULTISPECIES: isopentenyl-diphosphate Delta-isomerase [unclassified Corynebacterium]MCS4492337.1 isopentenyl-diphosphate Delta-isomerase [Corynebacterium sp. ES2715-CONJ3]MCS4532471.1 isopentenyl-diphosphate Delta-isomerase [Corynebacterium sp. ES2730-CONJ]